MRTYRTLLLASIAASVISTASSWFFYSRWNEVEDGHFELMKKNSELLAAYDLLETAFDSTSRELTVMHDASYKVISLREKVALGKEVCRIWWNPYNRKTFFDPLALPVLEGDSVYQLWCSTAGSQWLVAAFDEKTESGALSAAGQVATADAWHVRTTAKSDTSAPSIPQFRYSSRY